MNESEPTPLSPDELAAEAATPLPRKEVMSLLDLNADINAALDLAAPIDLAVAANANVAAPIEAAVGANVLSVDSKVGSLADQAVGIQQDLTGTAIAHSPQHSTIDQAGDPTAGGTTTGSGTDTTTPATGTDSGTAVGSGDPAQMLNGNLLNVNVNASIDAKLAAPIDGAVAANANAAAPIDASVGANIASVGSEATSVASQQAIIEQHLDGTAQATADQTSSIQQ